MADVTNAPSAARSRRNRKKKSKSKKDDAQKEVQQLRDIEDSKMNSHVKLRNGLQSEGFSTAQIDKAMEKMWNNDLAYDKYDAVLEYLKSGGKEKSSGGVEETKETEDEPQNGNGNTVKPDLVEGNSRTKEEPSKTKPVPKKPSKPAAPTTMATKLDMVAGFEYLSDAIFAMTEWIIKAAKPHELEDLCAAVKTSALPTVIQRSILECEDQSKFDTAILPAMVRLLDNLLKNCGMLADDTMANHESFKSILRQARTISQMMNQERSHSIADRVSVFIVSRIFVILKESKATKSSGDNGSSLKSETDSLTWSLQSVADQGTTALLSKREVHKIATKRFCVAAQSACHSLSGINGSKSTSNGVSKDMGTDKEDIFSAIVDEDTKNSFDQHSFMYTELKTQVKEGERDTVKQLRKNVEDLQTERKTIAGRLAELRESIEKLEAQDEELFVKQESIQSRIDAECESESKEAGRLNSELQEATKQMKGDESIRCLVDLLKTFDDSLASRSVQTVSQGESAEENASKMMDMYLLRARNYFMYESSCYQFLQSRIKVSQKEVSALNLEVEMCQGLGMTTTIDQMEQTMKYNEQLIAGDTAIVERIKADANSMFHEMMNRLEEYTVAQNVGKSGLLPIRAKAMQGIPQCISKLEVPNGNNLDAFLAIHDILSIQPPPPPNNTQMVADAKHVIKRVVAQNSTAAPKFTWANGSSASDHTQKASLLDIQKEELESKAAS